MSREVVNDKLPHVVGVSRGYVHDEVFRTAQKEHLNHFGQVAHLLRKRRNSLSRAHSNVDAHESLETQAEGARVKVCVKPANDPPLDERAHSHQARGWRDSREFGKARVRQARVVLQQPREGAVGLVERFVPKILRLRHPNSSTFCNFR